MCYCSSLLYDKSIDYQTGWKSEQKPYVETGDMQFNLSESSNDNLHIEIQFSSPSEFL